MAGEPLCPHSPDIAQNILSSVKLAFHNEELIHKRSIVPSCKWRAALYCSAATDRQTDRQTERHKIASSSADCFPVSGGDGLRLSFNHLVSFCMCFVNMNLRAFCFS